MFPFLRRIISQTRMIVLCERNVCHTCERIMAKLFIFPIKIFIFFLAFSAWTYWFLYWFFIMHSDCRYYTLYQCNVKWYIRKWKKKPECRNECLCTMYLKHFCTCEDFTSLSKIFFQMFMTIMLIRKSSQNFLVQFFWRNWYIPTWYYRLWE